MVLSHSDVDSRMEPGAALADDDAAGIDELAGVRLDAQALRFRVAAVARTAACFFVCHGGYAPSADNAVDLEFGEVLAVTLVLLVVLAPAHLENRDLVAATVPDDSRLDRCAGDDGLP